MPEIEDMYLGDGVYASFDGYHVWLAVNNHKNKVVALEPEVLVRLAEYLKGISKVINKKQEIGG